MSSVFDLQIPNLPVSAGTCGRGGAGFHLKGQALKPAVMFDLWVVWTEACHALVFKTPGDRRPNNHFYSPSDFMVL